MPRLQRSEAIPHDRRGSVNRLVDQFANSACRLVQIVGFEPGYQLFPRVDAGPPAPASRFTLPNRGAHNSGILAVLRQVKQRTSLALLQKKFSVFLFEVHNFLFKALNHATHVSLAFQGVRYRTIR